MQFQDLLQEPNEDLQQHYLILLYQAAVKRPAVVVVAAGNVIALVDSVKFEVLLPLLLLDRFITILVSEGDVLKISVSIVVSIDWSIWAGLELLSTYVMSALLFILVCKSECSLSHWIELFTKLALITLPSTVVVISVPLYPMYSVIKSAIGIL